MNLQELFPREDVLVGLGAVDKWEAIDRLLRHLVGTGRIGEEAKESLLEAVLDRERSMSTGMEHGIAIPHAAVSQVDELVSCLATCSGEGVAFEAIDGGRTHIVVLLLIPRAKKLLHIRTLADIARMLTNPEVRRALVGATTSEEAWEVLGRAQARAR